MQRYQCVVHRLADGQQLCAASHYLGISALGKIHLIFDHFRHGLARRKHIDGGEPVLRKNLRDFVRFAQQRMVVSTGGTPDVDPRRIVVAQQRRVSLLKGISLFHTGMQREPPRQKIAAELHVDLPVVLDLRIGTFQFDMRIGETALTEQRLGAHDGFRALSVVVGDLIVMGHTFVHFGKLALQFSRRAIEHHQNGRRAEGPAAAILDADGGAGHLRAGAAVQAAHGADVIVAEKTHNEVALAQQVAAFFLGQLRVLLNGCQQQRLQLQHFRDLPPCEHPAHQHQNGKGM